jgi:hypothetical protein
MYYKNISYNLVLLTFIIITEIRYFEKPFNTVSISE